MSRWERFWMRRLPLSYFAGEDGEVGETPLLNRRATDTITPELIKQKANNGQSTKELIAEVSLKNDIDHAVMKTTLSFHNKFIWTCIGILITAFTGGLIALIFAVVRNAIGG